MKTIKTFMELTLSVLMIFACSSEQKLAPIAKDYLVAQGNDVSSVKINPGKVEGYYECEATTLGLVENYLVHEVWDISFKNGNVVSAVKRAPSDSTLLTKMETGEQVTLKDFYKSVLPSWMQSIYKNKSWSIGNLYSLGDMYYVQSGTNNLSCYDAVIGLCDKLGDFVGYEWKKPITIRLKGYKLDSFIFNDNSELEYDSILINPSTGEEITVKKYEKMNNLFNLL